MTPIFVNRKMVGQVDGFVFKKKLNSRKHFLRKPPAIAFDDSSVEDARAAGADRIGVKDEKGNWYVAFIELLDLKGYKFDRGYGKQVALTMKWWKPNMREAEEILKEVKTPKPIEQQPVKQTEMSLI